MSATIRDQSTSLGVSSLLPEKQVDEPCRKRDFPLARQAVHASSVDLSTMQPLPHVKEQDFASKHEHRVV